MGSSRTLPGLRPRRPSPWAAPCPPPSAPGQVLPGGSGGEAASAAEASAEAAPLPLPFFGGLATLALACAAEETGERGLAVAAEASAPEGRQKHWPPSRLQARSKKQDPAPLSQVGNGQEVKLLDLDQHILLKRFRTIGLVHVQCTSPVGGCRPQTGAEQPQWRWLLQQLRRSWLGDSLGLWLQVRCTHVQEALLPRPQGGHVHLLPSAHRGCPGLRQ